MNEKLKTYFPIADMIASTFGNKCEVIVHDLSQPETSVVYVAGQVTGRKIGQSFDHLIKNVLLNKEFRNNQADNYIFHTPDGRTIKSSSALIQENGETIGMLCINYDLTVGQSFYQEMASFYCVSPEPPVNTEVDVKDDVVSIIDDLINNILGTADTTQLNRKKCVELVKFMDDKGIFLVKGALEKVATRLGVSKVTIYSYLDEAKGKR